MEKEWVKILWDFKTDRHLVHKMPDITVIEKKESLLDVAVVGNDRLDEK